MSAGEDRSELAARNLRVLEALIFASRDPVSLEDLRPYLSDNADIDALIGDLQTLYAGRGVILVQRGSKWAFRTADDLSFLLRRDETEARPLSRAALETLSIVAYHQPVTRAEIEEVRGVSISKGTLDVLMEAGWVRMRGRRRSPGRPVTYGTTEGFLDHFGLESLGDLPGLDELKGAGLLSSRLPAGFQVPLPFDGALRDDEEPLDAGDSGDTLFDDDENS
ncbi:SMC-Scp complex subunit ScpB [Pelagibacterium montanilacus]|uniref:SMC-Scp complex subunit ScpB n=1 Tax=Pelagibacterium montanilacus TaxID=2185280 RepID=UPI000F8DACD0|nr:SMC-Scp complex subunit ScpB [Pelagibacterium montanilacus]